MTTACPGDGVGVDISLRVELDSNSSDGKVTTDCALIREAEHMIRCTSQEIIRLVACWTEKVTKKIHVKVKKATDCCTSCFVSVAIDLVCF